MIDTVAVVPGTGTGIVIAVFRTLGVQVNIIEEMGDIKRSMHNGLLLLGGRDISPNWYGEKIVHSQEPDHHRDMLEWLLLRRAMTAGLPIMGICRGMQFLTVAHGGSLWQDIKKQRVSRVHMKVHNITATGKLKDCMPTSRVNSLHHQAVRTVPYGFKVLAESSDKVIEAVWKPGTLGVQWHPELLIEKEYRWINLFRWFLERGLQ